MQIIDPSVYNAWIGSPYALLILSAMSFSESAFFIIPPEVLLIPMALANPALALVYGALTTVTSIFGAIFGYYLGKKGGKPILYKLFSESKVETVKVLFQKYDTKAIFISAFTPIPYKVFTIAAGVFDIDFKRFLIASIIGRGARYMMLSVMIMIFGEAIRGFIENQLDLVIAVGTVGLIGAIGFYKVGIPFLEQRVLKMSVKDRLGILWNQVFHRN